jgi:transcriptional regulator with XRE-family HTH domain
MKYSDYRKKLKNKAEFQETIEQLNYRFTLGDAVLEARLKKSWSQTELARRAGTKQANISRIEAGMGNPTLDLIKRLCDVLDLEINFQHKNKENLSPETSMYSRNNLVPTVQTGDLH